MNSADSARDDRERGEPAVAIEAEMEQRRRLRHRLVLENERLLALENARRRAAQRRGFPGSTVG